MTTLSVLSYNVMFGRRSKKLFPWLAKQTHADIICLQEFPERKIEHYLTSFSSKKYSYEFAPSMRIFKKIYGELTLYRSDRLLLKRKKIINLGDNRIEKAILRTRLPRTALLTEFIHKQKCFVLVNPQLVSLASNKLRYRQIDIILRATRPYRIPSFIIGDFNIPSLLANKKLVTYMNEHSFTTFEKRMSTYRLAFIKYQLDYAFARKGEIEEINIERVRFSDHYPIRIIIRL